MDPSFELIRRNRPFGWYWLGQSLSMGGSQVTVVALPLVSALTLNAGPSEVGLVATAAMLPYLLFSMVAGHFLENLDKRRTMIPADLAQFLLIAAVPVAWAGGWLSVPLLAVIAFLSGTAALIFGIAGFAYVPHLVHRHELPAANRAVQGSGTVTEIAGPGIAGILVSTLGPALAMAVDALSYLASAVGVALGRPQQGPHPDPGGAPATEHSANEDQPSLWTGMRTLFASPYLRALTIHAAAYNLAEAVFMLNLVLWAVQTQEVSASAYGLALAAGGVGGLLGTLTALHFADRVGLGRAFALSLALSCGTPLFTAAWPLTGLALAAVIAAVMFVAGIGLGNANVYSLTLRQSSIPITQLARSAGAYTQIMYGSIPIGTALAGVIGEILGTRAGVLLGAAGIALSALPMLTRRILQLKTTPPSK